MLLIYFSKLRCSNLKSLVLIYFGKWYNTKLFALSAITQKPACFASGFFYVCVLEKQMRTAYMYYYSNEITKGLRYELF